MKEALFLFLHSKNRKDEVPLLPEYYEWKVFDEYTFPTRDFENNLKIFSKLYRKFKPQAFYTYKDNVEVFSELLSPFFECRKRWLHIDNFANFSVNTNVAPNIFGCLGFDGHMYSKNNPLFSVITTTFHSREKLQRPLRSLRAQTYKNWEWIVVDDSTKDDHEFTYAQIQNLADDDFRIRPFKAPHHSGYIGEMKRMASSFARGEWIVELDHDDDVDPRLLESIVQAIKTYPKADFVYCDTDEVFEDTGESRTYGDFYAFGFGANQRYYRNGKWQIQCLTQGMNPRTVRHIIGVPNHVRVWRTSFYDAIGKHNPYLSVADDYELLLRTFLKARDRVRIAKPYYIQYVNADGNNFTKIRNALIQHNSAHVFDRYSESLFEKLKELKSVDLPHAYQPYWRTQMHFPLLEKVWLPDEDEKTISIIVPTYNRADQLQKAIDSIFAQTYKNFKIYVVGDKCPTLDNTMAQIANRLTVEQVHKLFYWNLQDNSKKWGAVSRNYGLKMMATSQWITYLDDDNTWLPTHLESLMEAVVKDESDFAFSSFLIDGRELVCLRPQLGRIDSSSFLHKKELAETFGYWPCEDVGYANDWAFVKPWTLSKDVKWSATKKCTLVYNTENNVQTYESIQSLADK